MIRQPFITHPGPSSLCHITQSLSFFLSCHPPLSFSSSHTLSFLNNKHWSHLSFSLCYFAALLSLDSGLISIQHLCWQKAATHWFCFFITQTEKNEEGQSGWKRKEEWKTQGCDIGERVGGQGNDRQGNTVVIVIYCHIFAQTGHLLSGSMKAYWFAAHWHFCALLPPCST